MSITYTLTEFHHFLESISAYAQYKKQNPDSQVLTELIQKLDEALPETGKVIEAVFPLRLLLFKT